VKQELLVLQLVVKQKVVLQLVVKQKLLVLQLVVKQKLVVMQKVVLQKQVVQVVVYMLTCCGRAVYIYHKQFHEKPSSIVYHLFSIHELPYFSSFWVYRVVF
jgi:hypothetical protein